MQPDEGFITSRNVHMQLICRLLNIQSCLTDMWRVLLLIWRNSIITSKLFHLCFLTYKNVSVRIHKAESAR